MSWLIALIYNDNGSDRTWTFELALAAAAAGAAAYLPTRLRDRPGPAVLLASFACCWNPLNTVQSELRLRLWLMMMMRAAPLMNESFQFWNFLNEFVKTRHRRKRRKRGQPAEATAAAAAATDAVCDAGLCKTNESQGKFVAQVFCCLHSHSMQLSLWLRPCLTESCLWHPWRGMPCDLHRVNCLWLNYKYTKRQQTFALLRLMCHIISCRRPKSWARFDRDPNNKL